MSESLEIQLARAKSERSLQRDLANGGDLVKNLAQMVRDASAALPYRERYPGRDLRGEPQRVATPAAAGISASLCAVSLPGLFDRNGRLRRIPCIEAPGVPTWRTGHERHPRRDSRNAALCIARFDSR